MKLKRGKRYYWYPLLLGCVYQGKILSGLFTGEYDENNGNAILITKWGERWSVPEKHVFTKEEIK